MAFRKYPNDALEYEEYQPDTGPQYDPFNPTPTPSQQYPDVVRRDGEGSKKPEGSEWDLTTPGKPAGPAHEPSYEDFVRDYWAPDREEVLASKRRINLQPGGVPPGSATLQATTSYTPPQQQEQLPNEALQQLGQAVGDPGYNRFEDLLKNHWAPSRREDLIAELVKNYHAPDREAVIARYRNMPDSELWPHGTQHLPGGRPTTSAPPQGGTRWNADWFKQNIGTPRNMQELLALEPKITAAGGKLNKNASGQYNGKITTPDGRIVDIMIAAGLGGSGFTWDEGPGGGGEFSDPWGNSFEQAVLERLRQLRGDPSFPELQELVKRLKEAETNKKANTEKYVGSLRERVGELKKAPYTEGQEAVLRAKAFDQLERRRQQTLTNRREEMYLRGHAPTSGTVMGAEDESNRQFEDVRTGIESDLLADSIAEEQRRKDKAVQLEGFIEQALSGADLQGLQYLSGISDIEQNLYNQREGRQREILGTYGPILDLISNRSRMLSGADGNGSAIDSLMGLLQMGNQTATIGRTYGSNQNNIAGLAQLLGFLGGG